MRISVQKPWRQRGAFTALLAMLISLFAPRALLSISTILFIAVTCFHPYIVKQLKCFVQSPLLISISLLFFIPFISGLWSSDMAQWKEVMQIKLPLLFFPVAFAGDWQLSPTQWKWVAAVFLLLIFTGSCWSIIEYLQNMHAIGESYLKAKSIPAPLENDHIRFSWMVCTGVILCFTLMSMTTAKSIKMILSFAIIWFIIYLHILSARTGLITLYLFLFLYGLRLLFKNRKTKSSFFVALLLILMPVAAWRWLPTFQNRIKYFVYDFSYVKSNTYLPGANDGNRTLSLKAGWYILQHHPFGAGAGDITMQTLSWYNHHIPDMLSSDKLALPSSEWLIYGATAGWAGVVLFTIVMFVPLFLKLHNRFFWIAINSTAALSLLLDIGLEVQFGVFLYAIIILGYWKWCRQNSV